MSEYQTHFFFVVDVKCYSIVLNQKRHIVKKLPLQEKSSLSGATWQKQQEVALKISISWQKKRSKRRKK